MAALAHLLFITALSISTSTLVFQSGQRIDVDGSVRLDDGRVVFRSGGALYSVPESEVDLTATRSAGESSNVIDVHPTMRLKVSEADRKRLLEELQENHSGKPAPPPAPVLREPESVREQASEDEWAWRRQAQAQEEAIRRAKEDLDLLTTKAAALKGHIAGLLSLGFKPAQFSYDSTVLQYTYEAIPGAELELRRTERAFELFRENARKLGIPPGWLR